MIRQQRAVPFHCACVWPDSNPSLLSCALSPRARPCLLPRSHDTDLNGVCGTSRPVSRRPIVPRKLIWAWSGSQRPLRRTLPDSVMLDARRCLLTGISEKARCLCVFGRSKVRLQWRFIVRVTSSKVGSTGYPDEKLTRASATAGSWKSLVPRCIIYVTGDLAGSQRGVRTFPEGQKINLTARKKIIRKGNGEKKTLSHEAASVSFTFL